MSKAFTREENEGPEIPDLPPATSLLTPGAKNYITPVGAEHLRDELERLIDIRRAEFAQGTDDPEAKRQLAKIDQRIMQLEQSLQSVEIVSPPDRPTEVIRFGATATVRGGDGEQSSYRIVGVDETDIERGWVSWLSPISKALLNRKRGDRVRFRVPSGEETLEILEVRYE
jgi:transcription elongation factor GreB